MVSGNMGIKYTSASGGTGVVGDIVLGSCLHGLTAQRYRDFLQTVLPGLLKRCASSCEADVVVSERQSFSAMCGRCPAVVERDISRKVDWTWRVDCMASSVAGSNCNECFFFLASEGALLRSHSQEYRRSRGETSSSYDKFRCQHIRENAVRRTAVCLEMDECRVEQLFNCEGRML
jgi:hypothetical protein